MPIRKTLEPGQERYEGDRLVVQSSDCHDWYFVDRMPGSRRIHLSHDQTVRGVYSWEEPTPEELAADDVARKVQHAAAEAEWERRHALWMQAVDAGISAEPCSIIIRGGFRYDTTTGECLGEANREWRSK